MRESLFTDAKKLIDVIEFSAPQNNLKIEDIFIVGAGISRDSKHPNLKCAAVVRSAGEASSINLMLAILALSEGLQKGAKISKFKIILTLLLGQKAINAILNKTYNSMSA